VCCPTMCHASYSLGMHVLRAVPAARAFSVCAQSSWQQHHLQQERQQVHVSCILLWPARSWCVLPCVTVFEGVCYAQLSASLKALLQVDALEWCTWRTLCLGTACLVLLGAPTLLCVADVFFGTCEAVGLMGRDGGGLGGGHCREGGG
jgi:hypothetical protein